MQTAVAVAAGGAVLELLTHRPLATNTAVYLALWGTLAVLRGLWSSLCECPDSVGAPAWLLRSAAGRNLWDGVTTAAGSAQRVDAGVLAFLAHLLSFVPVLVLGFLFQEGALNSDGLLQRRPGANLYCKDPDLTLTRSSLRVSCTTCQLSA